MLYRLVTFNEMQFCFMHLKGIIDAVLILKRLKEECCVKVKKLYM